MEAEACVGGWVFGWVFFGVAVPNPGSGASRCACVLLDRTESNGNRFRASIPVRVPSFITVVVTVSITTTKHEPSVRPSGTRFFERYRADGERVRTVR
eukprot:jgi/Psemu1/301495/fgenesh1_kg.35_\